LALLLYLQHPFDKKAKQAYNTIMNNAESQQLKDVIAAILQQGEVGKFFTAEELLQVSDEMLKIVDEIIDERKLAGITFHEDENMFFSMTDNTLHLGLGILKKMVHTWFEISSDGGQASFVIPRLLKEKIISTLRSDAAHEGGHRVIDRSPIKDIGLTQEEWGQLGISSLANALMDCRNDGRIMEYYPDLKADMEAGIKFGFGPGGRLDWPGGREEQRLRNGFNPLFTQFDMELMRIWAFGREHPDTDPRVKEVLEKYKDRILEITSNKKYVPSKKPHELEVKAKAKKVYKVIAQINAGEYQNVLLARDKENQTIHQAITIVGLHKIGEKMPDKLEEILKEKLGALKPELAQELEQKLEAQKAAKKAYDEKKSTPEEVKEEQAGKVEAVVGGEKKDEGKEKSDFNLLGPAVMVEELSEDLRDFLKKLFEEMQEEMQQELMQQLLSMLLQGLLGDPEKVLEAIEDSLNEKLRPHVKPPTAPTHQELANMPPPAPQEPPKAMMVVNEQQYEPVPDIARPTRTELEETERWLEENIDMKERITAWREAIYSVIRGARKKTKRPMPLLDGPELVSDEIRKKMGMEVSGKIFVDTKVPEREKIVLSVLWRTCDIPVEDALKLILFLVKIFSDEEIRKYLDLEILFSQNIPGVTATEGKTPVPVIVEFGDDPVSSYEKIVENLLALQKSSASGGKFPIVQDATALKTQCERLLKFNPGAKRKFAIDLWDEAAIEEGAANPMAAVQKQIKETQEALRGHAFCFVLKQSGAQEATPAKTYGEDNFLVERSAGKLISYLDVIVRTMIKYPDTYAPKIKEQIARELDIDID
jgi:hypothetical protein